jgi:hypothetical protein
LIKLIKDAAALHLLPLKHFKGFVVLDLFENLKAAFVFRKERKRGRFPVQRLSVVFLDLKGFFGVLESVIIHLKLYVVLCGVREENQLEVLIGGCLQSIFVALDRLNELLL